MNAPSNMRFVSVDEARTARGLRLVVVAGIPSPWSEAAKGIFDVKGLDYVAVRFTARDEAIRAWTSTHNAPVAFYDDDPPRSSWADILWLGEHLGGNVSLVPRDPDERVLFYGLAHVIMGAGGLLWNSRLLLIHAGLTTDGREGFPPKLAAYLGKKYGYAPDRVPGARDELLDALDRWSQRLSANQRRGSRYLLGDTLTALDIYSAAALGLLAPMPPELCPMLPFMRQAFESIDPAVRQAFTPELIAHRDFVYERHLQLPIQI